MTFDASSLLKATEAVTKKWTKQRKAEDKGRSRSTRMYVYSDRVYFTDVANGIFPGAYDFASGGGKYTVSQRQLYYACRESFKKKTGRELDSQYFTNTLLRQYLNRNRSATATWRVTADPRGTLAVPNSAHEIRVPCGTLQIERHLAKANRAVNPFDIDAAIDIEWPSIRHGERYQGVLYIEKEGFEPILQEGKIAERFDLAILSCKGQSVVAARKFVDSVCSVNGGVPLFVVHDLDKSGFEISQSLTTVSDWAEENDRVAYRFRNEINVTDLGLRLDDVEQYDLESETVDFKGHFAANSITTPEEQEFLQSGLRVELNAFSSPQFIEWLEGKLTEHGLGKRLIPSDDVLADAYRRALAVAKINAVIEEATDDAVQMAEDAEIPKTLRRQLQKAMKDNPATWDKALYRLAEAKVEDDDDDEE